MQSEFPIPADWMKANLESLTEDSVISYGVVQPGFHIESGIPMLRVNNFRGYGLDISDVLRIAPTIEVKYARTRLRPHDVLITVVGSVGQVAVVPPELTGWNLARAVALIRPRDTSMALWIALCLRAPMAQYALGMAANTTVQTTVNLKDLRKLVLPIPPARERVEITTMLAAIDDRLDLLRQTNATLEAIAQALFKSWFIDFGPVRAKAEGREPEGMDAATAALFPAEFQESALGLIPRGWSCGRLGNLIELAYGKALKSTDRRSGPVPVYGSGGITGYHDEALVHESSIIVGRKGTVGSLYWEDRPFFPIDTTFYVRTKSVPLTFCYYAMKCLGLDQLNTDAAVPGLNRDNAYRLNLIEPSQPILGAFDETVHLLRAMIFGNEMRAETLTDLRDTLLPRLISGKLRLPEAREHVEEALA